MYTDLVVVLKIGKYIAEISQEVGVRQGDNMAPVLFLFLMSAFAESLDAIWEENGLEKVELKRPSKEDFENGKGIIKSHKPSQYKSSKLKTTKVIQCLYVDDGVFLFKTRQQLIAGMKLVHQHMARFGLEIHIGREVNGKTKPSKTECVFFPPPQFFTNLMPSLKNGLVIEDVVAEEGMSSEENSDAIQEA